VKRIILIEDDTDARQMMAFMFENNGYEVVQADKELPLEQVAGIKPHIMVVDYKVNGKPGNDICLKLKANEPTQNIPIILYSAKQTMDEISLHSCADGFIAKPLELDDFIYLVHRIALS